MKSKKTYCTVLFSLCLLGCGEKEDQSAGDKDGSAFTLDTKPELPPYNSGGIKPKELEPSDIGNFPEQKTDEEMQKFIDLFSGLKPQSKEYKDMLHSVWEGIISSSFDRPITGSTNGSLPKIAQEILETGRVEKDIINIAQSKEEQLFGRQLTWVATLNSMVGGHELPNLLKKRSEKLPMREVDLAILYASLQGARELNPSKNSPILEEWEALATAQNPVYRLIALKVSTATKPRELLDLSVEDSKYNRLEAKAKIRFLTNYQHEKDSIILNELVALIRVYKDESSLVLLEKLKNNPTVTEDEKISKAVSEASAYLNKHLVKGNVSRIEQPTP